MDILEGVRTSSSNDSFCTAGEPFFYKLDDFSISISLVGGFFEGFLSCDVCPLVFATGTVEGKSVSFLFSSFLEDYVELVATSFFLLPGVNTDVKDFFIAGYLDGFA